MVREQKEAGYDFLKIHPGLTRAEFTAIAATANELGIPFAGHVPADAGVRLALELGIATIDHLDGYMQAIVPADSASGGDGGFFGLYLAAQADEASIDDIVAATRAAGTWNVPTQALFVHWISDIAPEEMRTWPEMRYMPADTLDDWVASKESTIGDAGYSPTLANRAIDLRRKLIKALHEALRTGTVNPARFFGSEERWGTVEVGRDADLVLLEGNPLEDISATREVRGVMVRGRWVSHDDIGAMLKALEN
jgi:imidazolonepropionase-like amidohydrolase